MCSSSIVYDIDGSSLSDALCLGPFSAGCDGGSDGVPPQVGKIETTNEPC